MSCEILQKKYIKKKTKYSTSKKNSSINNSIDPNSKCKFLVHEIVNPLNVISNCTELLKCNLNDDDVNSDKINEYLTIINNQIEICNNISKCILDNNNTSSFINIDDFIDNYVNVFNNMDNVNIITKFNNTKQHLIFLKKNKIYLKIILDNIFKNMLNYKIINNVNIYTCVIHKKLTIIIKNIHSSTNILETSDDCEDLNDLINNATQLLNTNQSNIDCKENIDCKANINFSCEKRGNGIGLELINKFCKLLNINWYLTQDNNDNYYYVLQLYLNNY